jgi:transglutaminase-like putative cysteine protease
VNVRDASVRDDDSLLPAVLGDALADAVTDPFRAAVLASAVVLTGTYLSVLYTVVNTVGGVTLLAGLVAGAFALAAVVARLLDPGEAAVVGVVLLAVGLGAYLMLVPPAYLAAMTPGKIVGDTVALVTGFSVLGMTKAGVWALSVAPAPVFLFWYNAFRRDDGRAALVGALALGFFVLTGDADVVVTTLGVLAAAGMLGFGTLATHGGGHGQADVLAVAFATMILAAAAVSAVPGAARSPIVPAETTSIEAELISADERLGVAGSIRLSPEVRFTVSADRADYWRVGAYDRYTGSGWVRTGQSRAYDGPLESPPGTTRSNRQVVEAKTALSILPAAAQPTRVSGIDVRVTETGGLEPVGYVTKGEDFTVVSETPVTTPARLATAGTDYPAPIRERYLQLPESTPDRVRDLAANVTADADNPYEKAVLVESWLESNKEYSLDVQQPSGDVVDEFLFERDRGYCVYFASAMVGMLRAQDVPARFVVGYTPGQRVAEDEWVVRGLDSHAWVEVYFEDVGWVRFDPTPGGPRQQAEDQRVTDAREAGVDDVDAEGSENGTWTPTSTSTDSNASDGNATGNFSPGGNFGREALLTDTPNGSNVTVNGTGSGDGGTPTRLPPPERLVLWALLAVGLAAAARRTGLLGRAYRAAWLRVTPRGSHDDQIAGAFDRVEYVLARQHRERRPDETVREYLDAIGADDDARRLARIRERARYAGEAGPGMAAEARELARRIVADRRPRLRRG